MNFKPAARREQLRQATLGVALMLALAAPVRSQGTDVNPVGASGPPAFQLALAGKAEDVGAQLAANPGLLTARNVAGQTLLHIAAARRDSALVTLLLEKGADPNARDELGRTPLHLALSNAWRTPVATHAAATPTVATPAVATTGTEAGPTARAVVELLLNSGADVNAHDKYFGSILAAGTDAETAELLRQRGLSIISRTDILSELLSRGDVARAHAILIADPQMKTAPSFLTTSLLQDAVLLRDTRLATWCLDEGWAVDSFDAKNRTPLLSAIEARQPALVDLLLARGASVNGVAPPPKTDAPTAYRPPAILPLEKAIMCGSPALVAQLVKAGADLAKFPNGQNGSVRTVGELALIEAANAGDTELQKLLLDKGVAPLNQQLLRRPLLCGDEATVRLLLERGAPANVTAKAREEARNDEYRLDSPLNWAASRRGNAELVKLLLDKGAEVGAVGASGTTALWAAAQSGDRDTVQLLIAKGALTAKAPDWDERETALGAALRSCDREMLELLLQGGARHPNALTDAILRGDAAAAKTLPEPARRARDRGRTSLHIAAWMGKADVVASLLERGLDIKAVGENGETPLHLAVLSNDAPTIKLLLDKGADVNAMANGGAPLHFAAMSGSAETVALLLKMGAERDLPIPPHGGRTEPGLTPLLVAARWGNSAAVQGLLLAGADPDAPGSGGLTPLMAAAQSRDVPTINALLAKGARITRDAAGQTAWQQAALGLHKDWAEAQWGQAVPRPTQIADAVPAFEALEKAVQSAEFGPAAAGEMKPVAHWEVTAGIAAKNDDAKTLAWLLDNGTAPDARNSRNETLLHVAALAGSENCVALLLARKADPNAEDGYGRTPVDAAELRGQATEAYVDFPFAGGHMGLERVFPSDSNDPSLPPVLRGDRERCAALLRKAGGNIGAGPLMYAIGSNAVAVVRDLVAQKPALTKAVMTGANSSGMYENVAYPPQFRWAELFSVETPLSIALKQPYQDRTIMVRLLIDAGVPLKANQQWEGAAGLALKTNSLEIMQLLLDKGADKEERDTQGKTLLTRAAGMSSVSLTKFLLDKGANPDARDGDGATALSGLPVSPAGQAIKALLEARGAKKQPFLPTFINNNDDVGLAAVLDAEPGLISHRFADGDTFLHRAVAYAHIKVIKLLLERGADVNALGQSRDTPLHQALGPWEPLHSSVVARYKEGELVPGKPGTSKILLTMLLDKGADPNLDPDAEYAKLVRASGAVLRKTSLRQPVLFRAIRRGDLESMTVLLDRGAKIDLKDAAGTTPLAWAIECKKPEAEALLRARGARE